MVLSGGPQKCLNSDWVWPFRFHQQRRFSSWSSMVSVCVWECCFPPDVRKAEPNLIWHGTNSTTHADAASTNWTCPQTDGPMLGLALHSPWMSCSHRPRAREDFVFPQETACNLFGNTVQHRESSELYEYRQFVQDLDCNWGVIYVYQLTSCLNFPWHMAKHIRCWYCCPSHSFWWNSSNLF